MGFFGIFGKSPQQREAENQAQFVKFTIDMLMDDARRHAITREAGNPGADENFFGCLKVPLQLAYDMFRDDQYTQQLQDLTFWIYRSLEDLNIPMPNSQELQDKDMLLLRLSELVDLAVIGDIETARRTFEQRFRDLFPLLDKAVFMLDTAQPNARNEIILADSERFLELTGIIIPELQRVGVKPPRIPDSGYAVDFNNRLRELRDMAAIGSLDAARKS